MFDSKLTSFVTNLAGLWLFNNDYNISCWSLIESILLRILELTGIIHEAYRISKHKKGLDLLLRTIFMILSLINHTLNLVHMFSQYHYRNLWRKLIRYKTRKAKLSTLILGCNFVLLFTGTFGFLFTSRNAERNDVLLCVYIVLKQVIHFFNNISFYQFTAFMENLIINLKEINNEMEKIEKQYYFKVFAKLLIRKHDELIKHGRLINIVFSWHNLLLCITCTLGFIANLYRVCLAVYSVNDQILSIIIVGLIFVSYYVGCVQTVAYFCEQFGKQVSQ